MVPGISRFHERRFTSTATQPILPSASVSAAPENLALVHESVSPQLLVAIIIAILCAFLIIALAVWKLRTLERGAKFDPSQFQKPGSTAKHSFKELKLISSRSTLEYPTKPEGAEAGHIYNTSDVVPAKRPNPLFLYPQTSVYAATKSDKLQTTQSHPDTPVLSPRIASAKFTIPSDIPPMKLARLVVVESAYNPSLRDELDISPGEYLRLLEEFEDEWCLVQRLGGANAEKGFIPRLCVVDVDQEAAAQQAKSKGLSSFSKI